jgi:hypothetical protein
MWLVIKGSAMFTNGGRMQETAGSQELVHGRSPDITKRCCGQASSHWIASHLFFICERDTTSPSYRLKAWEDYRR